MTAFYTEGVVRTVAGRCAYCGAYNCDGQTACCTKIMIVNSDICQFSRAVDDAPLLKRGGVQPSIYGQRQPRSARRSFKKSSKR